MYVSLIEILVIIIFIGCSTERSAENTYRGKIIQLDFSHAEMIEEGEWIEIDGVRFTHSRDLDKAYTDTYSLPATQTEWFGKKSMIDLHTIVLLIQSRLNAIERSEAYDQKTKNHVKASQDLLLYGQSIIRLRSENGEAFTVKTSPGYPIPIEVLEN